ncbi:MAG: hypothetical protein OSA05_10560 [Nitrospinaceae bacterium]|jgi:hypothetical protein|nr:hypothetical protein [Nitrospinaceae bacterium]
MRQLITFLCTGVLLCGCATSQNQLLQAGDQLKLRSIQTRAFDTTDSVKTQRVILATLQDLGFVIDKADKELGSISATKLDGFALKMTVSVRPKGETQLLVRANAQYQLKAVEDPQPYQNFFTALSKAMFLEAHQVE